MVESGDEKPAPLSIAMTRGRGPVFVQAGKGPHGGVRRGCRRSARNVGKHKRGPILCRSARALERQTGLVCAYSTLQGERSPSAPDLTPFDALSRIAEAPAARSVRNYSQAPAAVI